MAVVGFDVKYVVFSKSEYFQEHAWSFEAKDQAISMSSDDNSSPVEPCGLLVGEPDPDLDRDREARFLVGEREPDLELALDPLADRDLDLEPLEPDGDRDRPDWFSSPAPRN